MTIKKIITKAWAVTMTLYKCSSASQGPTVPNSRRISNDKDKPIKPAQIPKMKYRVPMSLWFVDMVQRSRDDTLLQKNQHFY